MNRKDLNLQKENNATREKGLNIVRELDRVVSTVNTALKDKDDRVKSIEACLQGLGETLQENLNCQYVLESNFETYDKDIETILLNQQHIENEERTYTGQIQRLLKGINSEGEIQGEETTTAPNNIPANNDTDNIDALEILKNRRENYLQNLSQEFNNIEAKLASVNSLRKELEESCSETREKKTYALEKMEALEDEGIKLLNEVERLGSELETMILEEKYLIEESVKIINKVEGCLEMDEKMDHALFSSENPVDSAEATSTNGPSELALN